jgi:hypothetical protein
MPEDKYGYMMNGWVESAKSCSQLATAALFLPVFYLREIGGVGNENSLKTQLNDWFVAAWIALLVSIILAQTYQITATKLVASYGTLLPKLYPRTQYWLMLLALGSGVGCFVFGTLAPMPTGIALACSLDQTDYRATTKTK